MPEFKTDNDGNWIVEAGKFVTFEESRSIENGEAFTTSEMILILNSNL